MVGVTEKQINYINVLKEKLEKKLEEEEKENWEWLEKVGGNVLNDFNWRAVYNLVGIAAARKFVNNLSVKTREEASDAIKKLKKLITTSNYSNIDFLNFKVVYSQFEQEMVRVGLKEALKMLNGDRND